MKGKAVAEVKVILFWGKRENFVRITPLLTLFLLTPVLRKFIR